MVPQRKSAQFDLPAGTMLGKYEVLRKLAMGGMAEIYLCRVTGTAGFEKLCVVKRILPTMTEDPTFVQMFLDEARLAATLQHPNIADVYEVGEDDGAPYFAMEFIHGQDVRAIKHTSRQRKENVPLAIALAIVHGTASALDYAHDRTGADGKVLGLVHRDVSSSNILVGYEGAIKLIDFGIARATNRTHQTRTGTLKGKIPYMSPEQCRGANLDRRSDLFSLGVVLYELTTGRRPFRGDTDFMIMDQIVNQGAKPPSTLMRDYPEELERIVMKLLAPKSIDRYQSAEELLHELDPFIAQHRLYVSPKQLSKYMRTVFADNVNAWDSAAADGVTLAQFVASRFTADSQRSDIATPPSAFPGLLPLSQEMPAVKVTGEMGVVTGDPTPLPSRIPSEIRDMPSRPTQYPSIKSSGRWIWFGAAALAIGAGALAFVMLSGNGTDEAAPKQADTTTEAKAPPESKSPETKPGETKPAETKPAETKPVETRPVETKSTETTATAAKPTEPVDSKPVEPTETVAKGTKTGGKTTATKGTKTPKTGATAKTTSTATTTAKKENEPATTTKPPDTTKPPEKDPGWDQDSVFLPPSK